MPRGCFQKFQIECHTTPTNYLVENTALVSLVGVVVEDAGLASLDEGVNAGTAHRPEGRGLAVGPDTAAALNALLGRGGAAVRLGPCLVVGHVSMRGLSSMFMRFWFVSVSDGYAAKLDVTLAVTRKAVSR